MLSAISRYGLFPLHERLVGRSTVGYARALEWSQWESPEGLRELQRRKLAALLEHAAANTSFYARRFGAAGVCAGDADPFEVLRRLPLLDKSEIRRNIHAMLWHQSPGGLHEYNTGGSTGEPLAFFIDRRRQAFDQAARIRTHRWFGVNVGDRELFLWGSPIERQRTDRIKRFRDRAFNQRLLDAFHMSDAQMARYVDAWNRFRPRALFGYPSSIARFVAYARRCGRRLDTRNLRAVFVTGEVCLEPDRAMIAEYFNVPVADGYGSREGGFVAHQCPHGGMHICSENVVVEIVGDCGERGSSVAHARADRSMLSRFCSDGGRSILSRFCSGGGGVLPVGEAGEIVLTHLDAWGMPFIRYRTGDVGRLLPGRCACGRGLPLMDVVQGRSTDFLYTPDGNVKHALSVIYPLRELPGVRRFRVTQHEDYSVTVDVEADGEVAGGREYRSGGTSRRSASAGLPPRLGSDGTSRGVERVTTPGDRAAPAAIADRLRRVLGGGIPIEVRLVDSLPAAASGKFRYVVSHAAPPGVARFKPATPAGIARRKPALRAGGPGRFDAGRGSAGSGGVDSEVSPAAART